MYLESLTINFMAWSHEELDGISYRTEEQYVCVCEGFQVLTTYMYTSTCTV